MITLTTFWRPSIRSRAFPIEATNTDCSPVCIGFPRNYNVFYRVREQDVEIVRIVHERRNALALLKRS